MTRQDFYKQKENGIKSITDEKKLDYFQRLITPYKKNGVSKTFISQYLEADGNELSKKFWSVRSSSRFAFELYSWMANDDRIKDICFEKKLKAIKGSNKKPNMDVYIEKDNRIIFIESKFSEIYPQSIQGLSDSYYLEKGESQNSKTTISKRYYGRDDIAKAISNFVRKTKNQLEESGELSHCWMDFKQEITHLIGIVLTIVLDESKFFQNKDVEFYNIYYDFEDEVNSAIKDFFKNANDLMNHLLVDSQCCKSFTYDHFSAQDMVKDKRIISFDPLTRAFASEKTVGTLLNEYFNFKV